MATLVAALSEAGPLKSEVAEAWAGSQSWTELLDVVSTGQSGSASARASWTDEAAKVKANLAAEVLVPGQIPDPSLRRTLGTPVEVHG